MQVAQEQRRVLTVGKRDHNERIHHRESFLCAECSEAVMWLLVV